MLIEVQRLDEHASRVEHVKDAFHLDNGGSGTGEDRHSVRQIEADQATNCSGEVGSGQVSNVAGWSTQANFLLQLGEQIRPSRILPPAANRRIYDLIPISAQRGARRNGEGRGRRGQKSAESSAAKLACSVRSASVGAVVDESANVSQ